MSALTPPFIEYSLTLLIVPKFYLSVARKIASQLPLIIIHIILSICRNTHRITDDAHVNQPYPVAGLNEQECVSTAFAPCESSRDAPTVPYLHPEASPEIRQLLKRSAAWWGGLVGAWGSPENPQMLVLDPGDSGDKFHDSLAGS